MAEATTTTVLLAVEVAATAVLLAVAVTAPAVLLAEVVATMMLEVDTAKYF